MRAADRRPNATPPPTFIPAPHPALPGTAVLTAASPPFVLPSFVMLCPTADATAHARSDPAFVLRRVRVIPRNCWASRRRPPTAGSAAACRPRWTADGALSRSAPPGPTPVCSRNAPDTGSHSGKRRRSRPLRSAADSRARSPTAPASREAQQQRGPKLAVAPKAAPRRQVRSRRHPALNSHSCA